MAVAALAGLVDARAAELRPEVTKPNDATAPSDAAPVVDLAAERRKRGGR